MSAIPTHPDAFTTAWLEAALRQPAGALSSFSAKPVGTGQMSLSFRINLDWKNGQSPRSLIAKCPSPDPGTRAIAAALRGYALELGWYRDLANQIGVSCPKCLHLQANGDESEFALLLEDMSPAQQGDQLAGATLTQIDSALTQAAHLHAPFWGDARLHDIAWLQSPPATTAMIRQMTPALYPRFRERYAERLAPEVLELCDAFIARVDAYFDTKPAALTVQHRDFRIDNILYSADGANACVVDWQTLGPGPGAADVAYLIGTSVADANVRAREEERWVNAYAERVCALGADANPEQIWREYRLYAFSGVLMAIIASTNVERTERGDEMFAVMTERPARQALHLESLSLL